MNEFNTYEFVVARAKTGKYRAFRILAVVCYVLFFLICAGTLLWMNLPWFIALLPLVEWMVVFFTWRYLDVEYEYSMTSGVMTFSHIYGRRSRKVKLELTLKSCQEIAPLSDEAFARLEQRGIAREYRFLSADDAPEIYYALFEEDEELSVVLFEPTQKALSILRFYNPMTVVTQVSR